MSMEVVDIETVNTRGSESECYVIEMSATNSETDGDFSFENSQQGKMWLRTSDLAKLQEEMKIEDTESGFGEDYEYSSHEKTVYDPPVDQFDFPMKVAEKWESTYTAVTEMKDTYDGETYEDSYEYDATVNYECLRYENVTVPAGVFEVFVIYEYEWNYENESRNDDDPWGNDSWEDDGWQNEDWEEDGSGGNGSVIIGSSDFGYTLLYYAPKLGNYVKIESYDFSRNLYDSFELVSYKIEGESSLAPDSDTETAGSEKGSFTTVLIIVTGIFIGSILIILLIGLVVAKGRRKKKITSMEKSKREQKVEKVEFRIDETDKTDLPP